MPEHELWLFRTMLVVTYAALAMLINHNKRVVGCTASPVEYAESVVLLDYRDSF